MYLIQKSRLTGGCLRAFISITGFVLGSICGAILAFVLLPSEIFHEDPLVPDELGAAVLIGGVVGLVIAGVAIKLIHGRRPEQHKAGTERPAPGFDSARQEPQQAQEMPRLVSCKKCAWLYSTEAHTECPRCGSTEVKDT